jgi:hypothetical protein
MFDEVEFVAPPALAVSVPSRRRCWGRTSCCFTPIPEPSGADNLEALQFKVLRNGNMLLGLVQEWGVFGA